MKQIRPDYYDHFSCTADQCPITCCQEWKISVDDHTNNCWKKLEQVQKEANKEEAEDKQGLNS